MRGEVSQYILYVNTFKGRFKMFFMITEEIKNLLERMDLYESDIYEKDHELLGMSKEHIQKLCKDDFQELQDIIDDYFVRKMVDRGMMHTTHIMLAHSITILQHCLKSLDTSDHHDDDLIINKFMDSLNDHLNQMDTGFQLVKTR